ncbi:MarR family winged helix-turn-helix transcriptional regulator [Rhodococcus aerolatus]
MTARYRPLLAELGLTYPQYLVMVALWEGGPLGVGRLGEQLRLDSSTLSPLLKRLETMGLVRRVRGVADARAVRVELTVGGRAMEVAAARVPDAICDATGMDGSEQAELVGVLRALAERLDPADRSVAHD